MTAEALKSKLFRVCQHTGNQEEPMLPLKFKVFQFFYISVALMVLLKNMIPSNISGKRFLCIAYLCLLYFPHLLSEQNKLIIFEIGISKSDRP